ncbi:MAG: hypothetical protein EZS28_036861 [Streblomastix strix]|uniref:Uncharacterized protein n=1 Tax=Streblomastix strix TaxID=222440 RepID=A0A5J4UCL9_9EUKA|nr:MAG: hypothetical protein EZS28_036861 [Streblomastix strix]
MIDEDEQINQQEQTFLSPIIAGKIIKQGGTSNQILLANGDTIDKDKLDYEPIENARYSAIAYGMYETRVWGTLTTQNSRVYLSMLMKHSDPNTVWQSGYTLFSIVDNAIKPKFSGTPTNIPLNAVILLIVNNKVAGINAKFKNKQMEPFGLASQGFNETIIYALDQLNINWHAIFKTIWEAAIKYACESKICH